MVLVYTAFFTPVAIYFMRYFFMAIPRDLEEAAMVDGCNRFTAFVKIVLPAAAPGLVATFVYAFLFAWDELLFVAAADAGERRDDPDRHPQLHRQLPGKDRAADGSRCGFDVARADRVLRDPALAREGHHRRGGEGMTATAPQPSLAAADGLPAGFRFGAATAVLPGRGRRARGRARRVDLGSLLHKPGAVVNGDTGDVACDHYHRWAADLDLMVELGLESYRFSIAWPRVQPDGRGALNPRGVALYRRLVEGLLERGIEPIATLYHWDLPQARQEVGGWAVRDTALRFAEYAGLMADALGDVVQGWITHNEPWVVAFLGHAEGRKAPGIRDWPTALAVVAQPVVLARAGGGCAALAGEDARRHHAEPESHARGDAAAASRQDAHQNRWFLDPVLRGTLSRRHGRGLRADLRAAADQPRGPGRDLTADRLPRRQLLQPDLRAGVVGGAVGRDHVRPARAP